MSRWAHILTDVVTYAAPTSTPTSRGDLTYGANTTAKARVEPTTRMVVGAGGTMRRASHLIITEVAIPLNAKIWVPGDDTAGPARFALQVSSAAFPDVSGTLYETYL